MKIKFPSKEFGIAQISLIIGLVIMTLALSVATKLSQDNQDLRNRAAYHEPVAPTPIIGASPVFLLGKVVNESPRFSECNNRRFSYGNNCGNSNCSGSPNYQITWSQSGTSNSVGNNECWSGEPRYTFERTNNPKGDQDGETVSVSISAGTGTRLVRWFMDTTDSNGNVLSGSRQQGTFSSPGQNQTVSVKVYKKDSYVWNHLWFVAQDPEDTPSPTPTPAITKPSCSGLTLNGKASNVTVNVGTTVRLASTVSNYGLISSAKVTAIGNRVWDGQNIVRYPSGTGSLSGVFAATQPGIYAIETNAYDNSSCNYLCSGGGIFYQNSIGPNRCVVSHSEWENIGSCTNTGCVRYITVNATSTPTPTKVPPTPTPAKYPVCGPDCKCGYSSQKPDMSKVGNIKCSYLPIGANCCSSCDRLVRITDFSVSNTNPAPGETITLKANGVSSKSPLTYRFNYYKQNASESMVTRIGYGCVNWDSSKLYPVKKMSNQYWTLIGTIRPTQDMVVSRISIPFKNSSSTPWSAHVAITDSTGLVSDNNFDSDSQPGSANHMFNLPNNPVACSKGGQRTMLVPRNTRKTEFYFDTRPVLKKGVAYKVWAATEGYEVYAMSCYDQYKPVEMEIYKSNVTALDAGDLGKASSASSRTWKVPASAAIGSTYVVMVEIGDRDSISNYQLPANTRFGYGAAAIKKTVVVSKPAGQCLSTCNTNADCKSGLVCAYRYSTNSAISGRRCRNNACQDETDCLCSWQQ